MKIGRISRAPIYIKDEPGICMGLDVFSKYSSGIVVEGPFFFSCDESDAFHEVFVFDCGSFTSECQHAGLRIQTARAKNMSSMKALVILASTQIALH